MGKLLTQDKPSSLFMTWLSLECSHELSLGQDVPFHGFLQFSLGCPGWQVQRIVESVELEEITVRLALRRGGTAVADVVEVVLPLLCPVSERCFRRHALLQITSLGWQVEENPMDPGATGSGGIIADKG